MLQLETNRLTAHYEQVSRQYDPLQRRLAHEHLLVAELCSVSKDIQFQLIDEEILPPMAYRITFENLRSIVSIDKKQLPVFGEQHMMEIRLTSGYPLEPPVCYMISQIWHPNIQSSPGPFQGRICGNTEGFGAFFSLDDLVLRVQSMLAYETYHSEMVEPYPEDEDVARWVREVGEPLEIMAKDRGLAADWELPQNWLERITTEEKIRISMV